MHNAMIKSTDKELGRTDVRLGATYDGEGFNFVFWAPDARSLRIHFYTPSEEKKGVVTMTGRKGGVWYAYVTGLSVGDLYAVEALGEEDPGRGLYFKEGRFLADPYAVAFNRPFIYDEDEYLYHSERFIPKAILQGHDNFNWQGVKKPSFLRNGAIIYETHVKSLTKLHPKVPPHLRGTYLGLAQPCVIEHLKRLGVTVVQLQPVAISMTEPGLVKKGLVNYWGYNPVNFFAPDPRYASEPRNVINEFKTMVRELHRNGIAVILDVVYNHTAEGGFGGPVLSFKGFDNRSYYAFEEGANGRDDYTRYMNCTGCGNSFNTDSPYGLQVVHQAMEYWSRVMLVDGFRFDLATTVARETHRGLPRFIFEPNSAFFKTCFSSRLLSSLLLVAEPWDVGFGGYQLGNFPLGWSEQNDRFRDTVRKFWRGDRGLLGEFATRIMGSRDIFLKGKRSINASVNFVTYHDGFTMEDLVSYNYKHNELNLENNQDGANENYSCNCGQEGPTDDPGVIERRERMKRNLMATVILSQGVPHLMGGDELGHTQLGNNNAYCQDNDLSYYNWNITNIQNRFIDFISNLITLRQSSEILRELNLDDDNFYTSEERITVSWLKPDGEPMTAQDWNNPDCQSFMLHIGELAEDGEDWCFIFNQGESELYYQMPVLAHDHKWSAKIDTSEVDGIPKRFSDDIALEGMVAPFSIKILKSQSVEDKTRFADMHQEDLWRHRNRVSSYVMDARR